MNINTFNLKVKSRLIATTPGRTWRRKRVHQLPAAQRQAAPQLSQVNKRAARLNIQPNNRDVEEETQKTETESTVENAFARHQHPCLHPQ